MLVMEQYFEDFGVGQTFGSGWLRIDTERSQTFAAEFDPQPLPSRRGGRTRDDIGGLVASGWLTAAVTMRLLVDSEFKPAGGILSLGFDELRWPRPRAARG